MATESTGHRAFRIALLAETAINLSSILPMILVPELPLSYIVKSPADITPPLKSVVQWTGAILTLATAPLLLCYPDPSTPSSEAERAAVTERRRLTYSIMGVTEAVLASTTAWQWLSGGSGLTDASLVIGTLSVGGFGLVRGWVILMKGHWFEPSATERKTQ